MLKTLITLYMHPQHSILASTMHLHPKQSILALITKIVMLNRDQKAVDQDVKVE